jgi:hypothetical protein
MCLLVELVNFMMLHSPIRAPWLFRAFPCYFLNFSEGFVMSTQVKVQANSKLEFNGYFIRAGVTMSTERDGEEPKKKIHLLQLPGSPLGRQG